MKVKMAVYLLVCQIFVFVSLEQVHSAIVAQTWFFIQSGNVLRQGSAIISASSLQNCYWLTGFCPEPIPG
jgi:hypothetical protein